MPCSFRTVLAVSVVLGALGCDKHHQSQQQPAAINAVPPAPPESASSAGATTQQAQVPADDGSRSRAANEEHLNRLRRELERAREEFQATKPDERPIAVAAPVTVSRDLAPATPAVASSEPSAAAASMEETAEAMFGDALVATRRRVDDLNSRVRKYLSACDGKTTQGNWLLQLRRFSGPDSHTFIASTATDNETTPECRMLWSDMELDANTIKVDLEDVAERARRAGIYPGVLRDMYRAHGLEEVVDALNR